MVQLIQRDLNLAAQAGGERSLRILAKSLYKELRQNGYDVKQIVSISSELISLVTSEIKEEDPPEG